MIRVCRCSLFLLAPLAFWTGAREVSADIYRWEYIDPMNPAQGKQQSTTLVPDGAGVSAVPGAQLSSRDLTMGYFIGVNLTSADLSHSNLTDADFSNADLTDAILSGGLIKLQGANFTGANVKGVNFLRAVTDGATVGYGGLTAAQVYSTASYQAGNLEGINFGDNDLTGWDFSGQNLTDVNFWGSGTKLNGVNFAGAVVKGVNFSPITLSIPNGFTASQLYSTASYQAGDLAGVQLANLDLSGWDLSGQNFTFGSVGASILSGTNFSNADVRGAYFYTDPGRPSLTASQLYSTASYQMKDLTAIKLTSNNLAAWNFTDQNLSAAWFDYADLTGADFTGANIEGAQFSYHTTRGTGQLSAAQLYSTASYQSGNLTRLRLHSHDLTGWNFSGQYLLHADLRLTNLANTDFSHAFLADSKFLYATFTSDTNLTAADLRGANSGTSPYGYGVNTGSAIVTNTILANGEIAGLDLTGGRSITIRDFDGNAFYLVPALPVLVRQHLTMDQTSLLQIVFEEDEWNSLISFESGISVTLGGTLELDFATGTDVASQTGRTIRIFNWAGVAPMGQFIITSPHTWDLSQLYVTGEVTLMPEPLPGDFNNNGVVDAADYVVWRKGLDTIYTQNDYDVWRANFGRTAGSGSNAVTTVPEPAGLLLAAIGGCIGVVFARRHRATALVLAFIVSGSLSVKPAIASPPGCLGDYNNDGHCADAADYVTWRKAMITLSPLANEGDSIGTTDAADYSFWRSRFGTPFPGSGSTNDLTLGSGVPEPSGLLLAAIGGLATFAFARRRMEENRVRAG